MLIRWLVEVGGADVDVMAEEVCGVVQPLYGIMAQQLSCLQNSCRLCFQGGTAVLALCRSGALDLLKLMVESHGAACVGCEYYTVRSRSCGFRVLTDVLCVDCRRIGNLIASVLLASRAISQSCSGWWRSLEAVPTSPTLVVKFLARQADVHIVLCAWSLSLCEYWICTCF